LAIGGFDLHDFGFKLLGGDKVGETLCEFGESLASGKAGEELNSESLEGHGFIECS
jgi:hypothetical protein